VIQPYVTDSITL